MGSLPLLDKRVSPLVFDNLLEKSSNNSDTVDDSTSAEDSKSCLKEGSLSYKKLKIGRLPSQNLSFNLPPQIPVIKPCDFMTISDFPSEEVTMDNFQNYLCFNRCKFIEERKF